MISERFDVATNYAQYACLTKCHKKLMMPARLFYQIPSQEVGKRADEKCAEPMSCAKILLSRDPY